MIFLSLLVALWGKFAWMMAVTFGEILWWRSNFPVGIFRRGQLSSRAIVRGAIIRRAIVLVLYYWKRKSLEDFISWLSISPIIYFRELYYNFKINAKNFYSSNFRPDCTDAYQPLESTYRKPFRFMKKKYL